MEGQVGVEVNSELSRWIDNIIGFTELAAPKPADNVDAPGYRFFNKSKSRTLAEDMHIPLSAFGAVRPMIDPLIGKMQSCELGVFMDAQPKDVSGRWDIATIKEPGEDWGKDAIYQLLRTRRVPLNVLRGMKTYSEYVCEQIVAVIFNDGTYETWRGYYHYVGKGRDGFGRWVRSAYISHGLSVNHDTGTVWRGGWVPDPDEEVSMRINAAIGLQFTEYYEWGVTISSDVGIPVKFATDPEGARRAFAERDKPASGRRESLKRWISQHWRAKRPDREVFVREHMRGMEEFNWCGFNCKISPSQDAIAKDDKLVKERKELEREGKTLRVRKNNA
jgi:hypothetical protein